MRLVRFAVVQADCSISIHALTRSATRHEWQQFDGWRDFNPRTHEECDRIGKKYRRNLCNFNPRTHEECDDDVLYFRLVAPISIHALTRSATHSLRENGRNDGISIHALTRSATRQTQGHYREGIDFNPRTHEECDLTPSYPCLPSAYFNPRTHEECDI